MDAPKQDVVLEKCRQWCLTDGGLDKHIVDVTFKRFQLAVLHLDGDLVSGVLSYLSSVIMQLADFPLYKNRFLASLAHLDFGRLDGLVPYTTIVEPVTDSETTTTIDAHFIELYAYHWLCTHPRNVLRLSGVEYVRRYKKASCDLFMSMLLTLFVAVRCAKYAFLNGYVFSHSCSTWHTSVCVGRANRKVEENVCPHNRWGMG